jgi:hypothetical protein
MNDGGGTWATAYVDKETHREVCELAAHYQITPALLLGVFVSDVLTMARDSRAAFERKLVEGGVWRGYTSVLSAGRKSSKRG